MRGYLTIWALVCFRNDWIRKKQSPDKRREKKEKKTACFMRLFVQDS
jgi:hypothetical protein